VSDEGLPLEPQSAGLFCDAALFALSPDGLCVLDLHGAILLCNDATCAVLGRERSELEGVKLEALLAADGLDRYDAIRRSFSGGDLPPNADLPFFTGKNARRVINLTFSAAARDANSILIGLRDVTADRALERELTRTKEFLQRVIDSSVDAIVSADLDGTVLLFNPAAERIYGWPLRQVLGKVNARELYPAGTAREIMRRIRDPEHGPAGELQGYETEVLTKNGERVPVLLSAALIVHRDHTVGSVGVFTDLRARRRMEASLAEANRKLAEQEKHTVVATLAGAAAHELNQPLTAVAGYAVMLARSSAADERTSRAATNIVSEVDRMAEIVRKIGSIVRYETMPYVGGTRILNLERSTLSASADEGLASGGHALAELEKLASIGRNVANVAHEISNPLTAILSYAGLLCEQLRDRIAPSDHKRIEHIVEAASRIRRFARELIEYSRPAPHAFALIDIHDVLERAIGLCAHILHGGDVTIDRAFGAVPRIEAMESPLTQVFVNLITNAAHAMADRGGNIRLGTEIQHGGIVIEVADDGPGVAAENLTRVFEAYFTTKTRGHGSGLGLSIAQQIVHDHGGLIRLHTAAPHGARFRIELPLEQR